jgi:hypothetical protein
MDTNEDMDEQSPKSLAAADARRREALGIGSLMRQSSMPELSGQKLRISMETASESAALAAAAESPFVFTRTTSAEDDTVGAIRTRVMNAKYVKQHRSFGTVEESARFDPKKGMNALRSVSMPSRIMKQVAYCSCGKCVSSNQRISFVLAEDQSVHI